MYACISMHVYIYVCICMYVYVCVYVCGYVCVYMYVCMYVCMCVGMHNILGGIVRGANVLPKTGGGIVRGIVQGELSYTSSLHTLKLSFDFGFHLLEHMLTTGVHLTPNFVILSSCRKKPFYKLYRTNRCRISAFCSYARQHCFTACALTLSFVRISTS